jgi:predicted porin
LVRRQHTCARAAARLEPRGWRGGDPKAEFACSRVGTGTTAKEQQRLALGHHYILSKRTRLYADMAHEREIADRKTGYDIGIQHFF